MPDFVLEVKDYENPRRWRWVLCADDTTVGAHTVNLNPDDCEYAGFINIDGWLRTHGTVNDEGRSERELADEIGDWIGREVFGTVLSAIAEAGSPSVVRVCLPTEAAPLLQLPFELARVAGRRLPLAGISFVYEVAGAHARSHRKVSVGEHLRMLAVFSLPDDETPLGLRRERHELERLVNSICQSKERAVELRSSSTE